MAPQFRSHRLTRLFNLMLLRVDRRYKSRCFVIGSNRKIGSNHNAIKHLNSNLEASRHQDDKGDSKFHKTDSTLSCSAHGWHRCLFAGT